MECFNKNIYLYHIWEDDWLLDKNKVISNLVKFINSSIKEYKKINFNNPKKISYKNINYYILPKIIIRNGYKIWDCGGIYF